MARGLVDLEHAPDLGAKPRIDVPEPLRDVLVHCGLAYSETLCRRADGRLVLDYVLREPDRSVLYPYRHIYHIPNKTDTVYVLTTPVMSEKKEESGFFPKRLSSSRSILINFQNYFRIGRLIWPDHAGSIELTSALAYALGAVKRRIGVLEDVAR